MAYHCGPVSIRGSGHLRHEMPKKYTASAARPQMPSASNFHGVGNRPDWGVASSRAVLVNIQVWLSLSQILQTFQGPLSRNTEADFSIICGSTPYRFARANKSTKCAGHPFNPK